MNKNQRIDETELASWLARADALIYIPRTMWSTSDEALDFLARAYRQIHADLHETWFDPGHGSSAWRRPTAEAYARVCVLYNKSKDEIAKLVAAVGEHITVRSELRAENYALKVNIDQLNAMNADYREREALSLARAEKAEADNAALKKRVEELMDRAQEWEEGCFDWKSHAESAESKVSDQLSLIQELSAKLRATKGREEEANRLSLVVAESMAKKIDDARAQVKAAEEVVTVAETIGDIRQGPILKPLIAAYRSKYPAPEVSHE